MVASAKGEREGERERERGVMMLCVGSCKGQEKIALARDQKKAAL